MNEIVIHNRVEREETGDVSWKKMKKKSCSGAGGISF